jgi:anti-sigma-K factor RskA
MSGAADEHPRFEDSVGAYLLGALTEAEERAFERHMERCPRCAQEMTDLHVAVEALPADPPPADPPPELKDRVMDIVNAEARLLSTAGARGEGRSAPERPRRRPPGWPSLRPVLPWAAAAVLLLAGAGVGFGLGLDTEPGAETVVVSVDEAAAPGARATMRMQGGRATIEVRGLPEPPGGRVYQVWIKRLGRPPDPTSALFGVRPDGGGVVAVPGDLEGVERVLVTHEPRGGSEMPSRAPVIDAPVS